MLRLHENANRVVGKGRVWRTTNHWHDELIHAHQANVPKGTAKLLRIAQYGIAVGQRAGVAGQIVPAAHYLGAVHVDQRIGNANVVGIKLVEKILVRNAEAPFV